MLPKTFHVLNLTMEVTQIRAEDGTLQKCIINKYQLSPTEVKTHSFIKFSKKSFGGILRPKSVRRPLIVGLIYGPRANKQFGIAF